MLHKHISEFSSTNGVKRPITYFELVIFILDHNGVSAKNLSYLKYLVGISGVNVNHKKSSCKMKQNTFIS